MGIAVSVSSVSPLSVPSGTSVAGVLFTCTGSAAGSTPQTQTVLTPNGVTAGDATQTPPVPATGAAFAVSAPDTYTITAQAVDQAGNLLGAAVSATAVVAAAPAQITVQVPGAINAVVA